MAWLPRDVDLGPEPKRPAGNLPCRQGSSALEQQRELVEFPEIGHFDVKERTAVLLGDGEGPVSFTAMAEYAFFPGLS